MRLPLLSLTYLFTLQLGHQSPCANSVLHSLHVVMQYLIFGAEDQVRTGDILLGRQTLYQLSYSRLNMAERLGVEPSERG